MLSKGILERTPVALQILHCSDAFTMHLYVKNYMSVNVNYIIEIQLKPK